MRQGLEAYTAITATGNMINVQDYIALSHWPLDYGTRSASMLPQKVELPSKVELPQKVELSHLRSLAPPKKVALSEWEVDYHGRGQVPLKVNLADQLNIHQSDRKSSTASTTENKSSATSSASTESQESGPDMPEQKDAGPPPIPWRLIMNQGNQPESLSPQATKRKPRPEVTTMHPKLTKHTTKSKDNDDCGPMFVNESETDHLEQQESLLQGHFHTVMIKHIPCRCSQKEVLEAVASVGFGELYNFFYLPIRRVHMRNFGYAFIGFPSSEITAKFAVAMTGYRFPGRRSPKACAVAPARIQGPSDNLHQCKKNQSAEKLSQYTQ